MIEDRRFKKEAKLGRRNWLVEPHYTQAVGNVMVTCETEAIVRMFAPGRLDLQVPASDPPPKQYQELLPKWSWPLNVLAARLRR